MKASKAMLKGYAMVGGNQCRDFFCIGQSTKPSAVCVRGAIHLARYGDADEFEPSGFVDDFEKAWGERPDILNDAGMPWEHIYGMAVAAGL